MNTTIQKQNKHILGTKVFTEATLVAAENPRKKFPSYFANISSYEIEPLFKNYYGHGALDRMNDGSMREFIAVSGVEAYCYDIKVQDYVSTDRFIIKYSKGGVHVIPVLPHMK